MNDRRADFVLVWWRVLSAGFDIVAIFNDMIIYQENTLKFYFMIPSVDVSVVAVKLS